MTNLARRFGRRELDGGLWGPGLKPGQRLRKDTDSNLARGAWGLPTGHVPRGHDMGSGRWRVGASGLDVSGSARARRLRPSPATLATVMLVAVVLLPATGLTGG